MAEPEPDLDTATVTAVARGEESGRSASRDRDSGNLRQSPVIFRTFEIARVSSSKL